MTGHPTPLERLIDTLQTALLAAQAAEQTAHQLADESSRLRNAIALAGQYAHELTAAATLTTGGDQ